jgi:hypothetical protein
LGAFTPKLKFGRTKVHPEANFRVTWAKDHLVTTFGITDMKAAHAKKSISTTFCTALFTVMPKSLTTGPESTADLKKEQRNTYTALKPRKTTKR